MFFERINRFRRSLAFRLTIVYTVMFTITSSVAFLIFYKITLSRINVRMDNTLTADLKEFSLLFVSRGIEGLKEEVIVEAESEGTNDVFCRL